jgi:hypothetical protein
MNGSCRFFYITNDQLRTSVVSNQVLHQEEEADHHLEEEEEGHHLEEEEEVQRCQRELP